MIFKVENLKTKGYFARVYNKREKIYKELKKLIDNNEFDKIVQKGWLKYDPVEWSARWEEVIDEAQREVDDRLADVPRGMGFCHGYWQELKGALKRRGVSWRSPSQMNPCVMFD